MSYYGFMRRKIKLLEAQSNQQAEINKELGFRLTISESESFTVPEKNEFILREIIIDGELVIDGELYFIR